MRTLKTLSIYSSLFATLVATSLPAQAQLAPQARLWKANRFIDNPDRNLDRLTDLRFLPLGEVETERELGKEEETGKPKYGHGTAFLVSPCYAISNFHVVYGEKLPYDRSLNYTMRFNAGPVADPNSIPFAITAEHTVVKFAGPYREDNAGDWVVLKLDRCLGGPPTNLGWFETLSAPKEKLVGLPVGIAGFPGDKKYGTLWFGLGKVTGMSESNGLMMYSAPTSYGQSGGIVFVMTKDKSIKVIGVNARQRVYPGDTNNVFDTYSDYRANEFVAIGDIVDRPEIKAVLEADRAGVVNSHLNPVMPSFPSR